MSEAPCAKCGRLTAIRCEDQVSGRIVSLCESCGSGASSRLFFMLLALMGAVVCLMQNF
jgi:hypothetical protein